VLVQKEKLQGVTIVFHAACMKGNQQVSGGSKRINISFLYKQILSNETV